MNFADADAEADVRLVTLIGTTLASALAIVAIILGLVSWGSESKFLSLFAFGIAISAAIVLILMTFITQNLRD